MYGLIFFVVGFVAVSAQQVGLSKCPRYINPGGLACCNKYIPLPPLRNDIKECLQLPRRPPPSCYMEICKAKHQGVASDDGIIDMKAMAAIIEKNFKNDSILLENVRNNCINQDVSKYGPDEVCNLKKFDTCVRIEAIKRCDKWNDDGDCSGMKTLIDECVRQFA